MSTLAGRCGRHHPTSPLLCTLPAGHAGPHQAHGYNDRVIAEWIPEAPAEAGAA